MPGAYDAIMAAGAPSQQGSPFAQKVTYEDMQNTSKSQAQELMDQMEEIFARYPQGGPYNPRDVKIMGILDQRLRAAMAAEEHGQAKDLEQTGWKEQMGGYGEHLRRGTSQYQQPEATGQAPVMKPDISEKLNRAASGQLAPLPRR
jgi:hypothetical protein